MTMPLAAIAPELRKAAGRMPALPIGNPLIRRLVRGLTRLVPAHASDGVTLEMLDTKVPPLRLYVPDERRSDAALLWIHGGGYVIGTAAQDDRLCGEVARDLGIVVVSVDYRLAPEHPFPAPLDDCFAAWNWLQEAAAALAVDPRRIAVGGQSAGAGLAAGLVQRIHDVGMPAKAQWLLCPMLDDRTAARRALDAIGHRVWNNRQNEAGWRAYLGQSPGAGHLPAYAAPARRDDLGGLPRTWIGVGAIDLFHDEDRDYAARLEEAGVAVTFHTVPGAPHGFEAWAPGTAIARDYLAAARAWLGEALAQD